MNPYTLIDTAGMPWEDMPGIPGFKRRLLRRDARTGASVEIQYAPPGFSEAIRQRLRAGSVRHFHRSVVERHYFLAGDLPNCDWKDLEDESGQVTIYRRHTFLDRQPLTLHGLLPEYAPVVGSEYLVWNTGSGTALWEAEAKHETVEVERETQHLRNIAFAQPRILQVDRLPVTAHPAVLGWKILMIASALASAPGVALLVVPPDFATRVRCTAAAETTWLFVLSGSLSLRVRAGSAEQTLCLYEGSFLDLDFSGVLIVENATAAADRGCTFLSIGLDFAPANWNEGK